MTFASLGDAQGPNQPPERGTLARRHRKYQGYAVSQKPSEALRDEQRVAFTTSVPRSGSCNVPGCESGSTVRARGDDGRGEPPTVNPEPEP